MASSFAVLLVRIRRFSVGVFSSGNLGALSSF